MYFIDTFVQPTILYSFKVKGIGLLEFDWACVKKVQTLLLQHIIKCKQTTPQPIILAKFEAQPLRLDMVFILVSLLHHILGSIDSTKVQDKYSYLA